MADKITGVPKMTRNGVVSCENRIEKIKLSNRIGVMGVRGPSLTGQLYKQRLKGLALFDSCQEVAGLTGSSIVYVAARIRTAFDPALMKGRLRRGEECGG